MIEQIRDFILAGGDFNETALSLWQYQITQSATYGRFCGNIRPQSWKEIPAIPVALFRDVQFTTFPPFSSSVIFRTSGTTGKRGTHILQNTDIYDLGAKKHMLDVIGGVPEIGLSLVSPAPDSSLGHMCRRFAPHMRQGFDLDLGVRKDTSWSYLESAHEPIFVPGTAFAFDALLHNRIEPCPLPEGSVVMVTGGYKGRRSRLRSEDLAEALKRVFTGAHIVGEYGMTELSSQLWSPNLDERFLPPAWMRVIAVNPESGRPTEGVGQLRFVDLANHQSVLAIETRDQGIVHSDGSVTLLGRLPNAPARGCSLTVEAVDAHFHTNESQDVKGLQRVGGKPQNHGRPLAIEQTISALKSLEHIEFIKAYSQGLSEENARWGLTQALNAITQKGLEAVLFDGIKPNVIAVVVAHGVFVSGLEWVAMAAASGATVLIKAPREDSLFYNQFAEALQSVGLSVSCTTTRDLGNPDWIIAFGGDETIANLQKENPNVPVQGYGHRFSVAVVNARKDNGSVRELARSIHAYDTRGCMAPVATFVLNYGNEWKEKLFDALVEDTNRFPAGKVHPHLAPEIRRRHGLARIFGESVRTPKASLIQLPNSYFFPAALPRTAVVHAIESLSELNHVLEPWKSQLSSIGWGLNEPAPNLPCRMVAVGDLQKPVFPRIHDGKIMWMKN